VKKRLLLTLCLLLVTAGGLSGCASHTTLSIGWNVNDFVVDEVTLRGDGRFEFSLVNIESGSSSHHLVVQAGECWLLEDGTPVNLLQRPERITTLLGTYAQSPPSLFVFETWMVGQRVLLLIDGQ